MRLTISALALLGAFGCDGGVSCRDRNLALIGAGGPIGWLVALTECHEPTPSVQPTMPTHVAEPTEPDVVDMATMPSPPVDMAVPTPPVPRDMTPPTPPADLSPVQLSLATSSVQNWYLSGPCIRGSDYTVTPSFDFVRGVIVPAEIKIPIASIPSSGVRPREVKVAYTVDADFAWGAPSPLCAGQVGAYYVKENGFTACLRSQVQAQVYADDILVDDRVVESGTYKRHVSIALPPSQFIPGIQPGQRIDVRLRVVGDVVVSRVATAVTAQLSW